MNAELLWDLFLRTGLPEAYLLFVQEKQQSEVPVNACAESGAQET